MILRIKKDFQGQTRRGIVSFLFFMCKFFLFLLVVEIVSSREVLGENTVTDKYNASC